LIYHSPADHGCTGSLWLNDRKRSGKPGLFVLWNFGNFTGGSTVDRATYAVGDIVVLKDGPLRTARAGGAFKILSVLPEANGLIQYRVRSEREGFDRRISSGDIEPGLSSTPRAPMTTATATAREPWFKASAIKVGK
jgi:hypothetical protein